MHFVPGMWKQGVFDIIRANKLLCFPQCRQTTQIPFCPLDPDADVNNKNLIRNHSNLRYALLFYLILCTKDDQLTFFLKLG